MTHGPNQFDKRLLGLGSERGNRTCLDVLNERNEFSLFFGLGGCFLVVFVFDVYEC